MAQPRRRRSLRGPSPGLERWRRFLFDSLAAASLLAASMYLLISSQSLLAVPAVLGLVGFAVRLVRLGVLSRGLRRRRRRGRGRRDLALDVEARDDAFQPGREP